MTARERIAEAAKLPGLDEDVRVLLDQYGTCDRPKVHDLTEALATALLHGDTAGSAHAILALGRLSAFRFQAATCPLPPTAGQPADARWVRLRAELEATRKRWSHSADYRHTLSGVLGLMDRIDHEATS